MREQAEAAVVKAREREEEAQVERAHAEAEESKVKAATAAMVAARKRMEEGEAEFRRAEAEMAAARSRVVSRMRAEAVAESEPLPHTQGRMRDESVQEAAERLCEQLRTSGGFGGDGECRLMVQVRSFASQSDAHNIAIVKAGGAEPLVKLLQTGDMEGKSRAARVLGDLAKSEDNQVGIARAGAVEPLVRLLRSVVHVAD